MFPRGWAVINLITNHSGFRTKSAISISLLINLTLVDKVPKKRHLPHPLRTTGRGIQTTTAEKSNQLVATRIPSHLTAAINSIPNQGRHRAWGLGFGVLGYA
jgi:hypothetical protein